MLKDLDFEDIGSGPRVIGPDFLLLEPHAIERYRRQAIAHLRELFGIRKSAAKALDLADMAADVEGRADVAERRGLANAHALADLEGRRDRRIVSRELGLHAFVPSF